MLTYIGTSPLSQAVSYWSTTWFISPVRPCHAYATSRGLLSTHHVVSHEMGPCYASLHRQCARHLQPSPTTQLVHLPGGPPATPPYVVKPKRPLAVSYQRTKLVYLPEGAPAMPS